jgi:hypothetical protein
MNIYISNDNLLTLDKAFDAVTQAYINDATVEVTLLDRAGGEVDGQPWPQTLAYVAESDGKYRAVLDDALELKPDRPYDAVINLDAGSGKKANWRLRLFATYRRE